MLSGLHEKFLNLFINISGKEDINTIQMKSIFKIYSLIGLGIHFIYVFLMIAEKAYIIAAIEVVYLVTLWICSYYNEKLKLSTMVNLLVSMTGIICSAYAILLGASFKYDLYIFLLVPLLVTIAYDKKDYIITFFIIMAFLFISLNYFYVYKEPIWHVSKLTEYIFSLFNSLEIFCKLYVYNIVSKKYSEETIQKLREDKKILDKDSKIDHLTGLYNRRSMEKYLSTLETQYNITNKAFGLILLDIDLFKKVNDTYGHQAGDKVLSEISKLIVYSLRKSDEVFRYGGEEILAVVTGVQTREEIIKLANDIREDIMALKIPAGEIDINVTISAGVTLFDGRNMDKVIKRVDEALYMAKNNGRNRVEYL